ncbi:MAG TPA: undecaprenyl-diphosphate phosphatase [Solirubrobacteraceae bacterium]|jgi:undecaprenyl-diphosphatase
MRRAIVLGLLQGPTEMAPVSSSAHTSILRWISEAEPGADAAARKSFEVALHGGTALALALAMGGPLRSAWRRVGESGTGGRRRRRLALLALSAGPPALAGYVWERPIERYLGGPRASAAGLLIGGVAMALADGQEQTRSIEQAGPADGLALGIAQATALIPGVSRRGATLTAARALRFRRSDADLLSWLTALPVIVGACALKGLRLRGSGNTGEPAELAAGAAAAFASTLGAARLFARLRMGTAPLAPFSIYRCVLGIALLSRRIAGVRAEGRP